MPSKNRIIHELPDSRQQDQIELIKWVYYTYHNGKRGGLVLSQAFKELVYNYYSEN